MDKISRFIDRVSDAAGYLAGTMILVSMIMVVLEIILRTSMRKTLYITEEYTGYMMAAITFLGLAYTLKNKGHIRMSFLQTVFKGRARLNLELYAFIVGLIFFSVITYITSNFFLDSLASRTRSMQISRTYLAIPHFFLPLGSFIMTLQFVSEIIKAIQVKMGIKKETELETEALGR